MRHEKLLRRMAAAALVILLGGLLGGTPVSAALPYRAYHYTQHQGERVQVSCPAPYAIERILYGAAFDPPLSAPGGLHLSDDGTLWIADTGNDRIVRFSPDGAAQVIDGFVSDGERQHFSRPEGVFVDGRGHIFVADTGNARIVELDGERQPVRLIATGDDPVFGSGYVFEPRRVAADSAGRLFVAARGQTGGIMQFSAEGEFVSFVGANRVVVGPLTKLWRRLMTRAQRERSEQLVPLEYSDLYMDDKDFLYVVTQSTDEAKKLRRLSPGGTDVMPEPDELFDVTGDAQFSAVCADADGTVICADRASGCLTVFRSDGTLLYAFGGTEELAGNFRSPSAVCVRDGRIYVADSLTDTVTVLKATPFAESIRAADAAYRSGDYDGSAALYRDVLRQDAGFTAAYAGLGRIAYRQEDYRAAMVYFRKADLRGDEAVIGYGKAREAYGRQRQQAVLPVLLPCLAGAAVLAFAAAVLWRKRRPQPADGRIRRARGGGLRFGFYLLRHPADGFWDMRHDGAGSTRAALILLVLWLLTNILTHVATEFQFGAAYAAPLDLMYEVRRVFLLFLLFCVSNWSVTTLMDGKGRFGDIVRVFGYASLPLTLLGLTDIVCSHVFSASGAAYYRLIAAAAWVWAAVLLFIGIMQIHEYSPGKTVGTLVLTAAAMVIVVFLLMVLVNIIGVLLSFLLALYKELLLWL